MIGRAGELIIMQKWIGECKGSTYITKELASTEKPPNLIALVIIPKIRTYIYIYTYELLAFIHELLVFIIERGF